ncbi:hypothetical protein M758_UG154000 [Ceratodon purpureus]|nr:hypothetical protein M758_UG154000 [Ceratodon purpureus]KAG0595268.1 hypothetical protein M758_UG154000 [Ceratodon purpureus]
MGCTASKDAVETNRKFRSAQTGRNMSMPVQVQGNRDNGFHMVALTSSTYGMLMADGLKINVNSVSLPKSSHDPVYENLKDFDVPDEMLAKSWSEVSRNLPKIPPPTRTDSLRRMDSPRLQTRGLDSPRQSTGSFRRTDIPRRLPSQVTKNDHETINTWELMDGLDEDGSTLAKPKLKLVERITDSPVIKPFERSVTFSTIHTLSELDSGDSSKAIAPGPAGNFLNNLYSADSGGKENTNPARVMSRSASSPIVPTRDEITMRLTPSSPSPAARVPYSRNDPPRPQQPTFTPMTLTPEANAAIQEVSKSLPWPSSPSLRPVGIMKSSKFPRPREPTVAALIVAPGLSIDTLKEGSNSVRKSFLPSSSPLLRSMGTKQKNDSPNLRQPATASMTVAPIANGSLLEGSNPISKSHLPLSPPSLRSVGDDQSSDSSRLRQPDIAPMTMASEMKDIQEGSNAVGKFHLPSRSPASLMSIGTNNISVMQVKNRSPGSQNSKSPMVTAVESPISLNTKLEAEIERAISEGRRVSGRQPFTKQPVAKTSLEPVRAVVTSYPKESAVARPQPTPRRVEVDDISNQPNRQVPRFASPIHVLSLAASFDLENRKNSMSHLGPKTPPGQSGRKSFSKQQSMPSSSLRAIPSSGQGIGLQTQASAPNYGRHGTLGTLNVSVGSQKDSLLLDSDLLASFQEVLEVLSTDDRKNVRDSKGEATSVSGAADSKRPSPMNTSFSGSEDGDTDQQGNGNKGEAISSKSSATNGARAAPRKIVKPDLWSQFELKCPPAGEDRVVLYTTSLRGIRKTFEDCNNARFIFESFNIDIDERDVSIHAEFRQELKELVEKPVPVPLAFIKGRYIGGMDIINQLHEDGTLATLVDGLPPQLSRGECDGCGGVRFVPCSDCFGSTKVVKEAKEVVRCSECNENGLMRCPICY